MYKTQNIIIALIIGIFGACSIKEEMPPANALTLDYSNIKEDTIKKYAGYIYKDLFNRCLNESYSSSNDSVSLKTFAYQAYIIGIAYYHTDYYQYPLVKISRASVSDLDDSVRLQIQIPKPKQFQHFELEERSCRKVMDYYDNVQHYIFGKVTFSKPNQVLHSFRSRNFFRYGVDKGCSDAIDGNFDTYDEFDLDYLEEEMTLLFGSSSL